MRTPKQAYDEATLVLTQRHQSAGASLVAHKESYKLGLQVALEQLKLSFHGVFQEVASTQLTEPKACTCLQCGAIHPSRAEAEQAPYCPDCEPELIEANEAQRSKRPKPTLADFPNGLLGTWWRSRRYERAGQVTKHDGDSIELDYPTSAHDMTVEWLFESYTQVEAPAETVDSHRVDD